MTFKDWHRNFWGFSVALYQDYKGYQLLNIDQKERTVKYKITNPTEQELYITGEGYSNRNYPRTCNPGNNYVLYLFDPNNKRIGTYAYIGHYGFATSGPLGEKLPKGDYTLYVVNQSYRTKSANLALNFYWADQKGAASKK